MIRVKISNFIKRNKNKISDLGMKLIIVAIVVFIATIMLSFSRNNSNDLQNNVNQIYKPRDTIIKGSSVTEEQYSTDNNVIQTFMQYCNEGNVEEAYALISNDCKENLYKTLNIFKESYYNTVFNEKRQYNLQSWISTNDYTIYRIRYTTDLLSTGKYEEDNVYQDYITLIKNTETPKISIGNFIFAKEYENQSTEVEELLARVIKKIVYLNDEEYEIEVKNKTQNTIMLDNLENPNNIKLLGESDSTYSVYLNRIFVQDVRLQPGETKRITIRFKKSCSTDKQTEYIQFYKVIRNYESYIKNIENYTDTFSFKIKI